MQIKFDSNQQYQLDAVHAIVDIFDGQPLAASPFEIRMEDMGSQLFSELGLGNQLVLDTETLLKNVQAVQTRNAIQAPSQQLETLPATGIDGATRQFYNFSVEMETGTGKTYVYLRCILELHQRYGFKKFIIVVPSIAIREGVLGSIRLTKQHFKMLYGVEPEAHIYDSKQVARLRQFATANTLQILVMNIQAFDKKDIAVIHKENDRLSGRKPIEFIQHSHPIVLMDEPQNMESENAKNAIASLNPLCTLRYSATHRNPYNLMYRLDPVKAYDLKLVKRIEVASVLDEADFNQPFIKVESITATATQVTAKLKIDVNDDHAPQRQLVKISSSGVDLFDLSKQREQYRGYIVSEIRFDDKSVSFDNGITIYEGQSFGGRTDEVMRVQVRETVKEHFEKELSIQRVMPEGSKLKVLSLFFIDRVANYYSDDGKIRKWFIEAYKEISVMPKFKALHPLPVDKVHNGYFASDKSGFKDSTEGKDTAADDEAYELIMRDKERLLSQDEPLRFIFSHSALREGWDNPNVFQICTLNDSLSEIKKRQEIGRGLRLPVMENGERCFDPSINRLTVIANESYDDFAQKLQTEIEEECGVKFEGRIANQRERRVAKLKTGWQLNEDFKELWSRIKHKTRYAVHYSTADLIRDAGKRLKTEMPKIESAKIIVKKGGVHIAKEGMDTTMLARSEAKIVVLENKIPDILSYLQGKTELTRSTIAEILIASGRLGEIKVNPQQFMDYALTAIQDELKKLMVRGIKYEKIDGQEYEMLLFEEKEIMGYLTNIIEVDNSIYDVVLWESHIERDFAEAMSQREDIKLFIKLPSWFKVDTPLGSYNPDWAIVKHDDEKVYLVRETKGTKSQLQLRPAEFSKIQCGKVHFEEVSVDYKWIEKASDV
ncbi:MAG: DEAD/DEAH box helicase family protein, partial [Methylophilaceae bacterium]|nr:DEAD/DEAH box helicase family protein [Methylophilaceae bacterium]